MKDKKSIAIVMLAAITAGVGIFSIVSNQSKLDAFAKLKSERDSIHAELKKTRKHKDELVILRDQLDSQKQAQEEAIKTLVTATRLAPFGRVPAPVLIPSSWALRRLEPAQARRRPIRARP